MYKFTNEIHDSSWRSTSTIKRKLNDFNFFKETGDKIAEKASWEDDCNKQDRKKTKKDYLSLNNFLKELKANSTEYSLWKAAKYLIS